MTDLKFDQHFSKSFNQELTEIRDKVLAMGGLVDEQLKDAVKAFATGDLDLAEEVVKTDVQVNAMEVDIDEECTQIIALRSPTATDLRLVITIIKTITDLERIGDEAERVAKMALETENPAMLMDKILLGEYERMGQMVRHMLEQSLDAFARNDAELAADTVKLDDAVDQKYKALTRQLATFMAQEQTMIPACLSALWAARALERIGDRSCNICEYVVYLVGGKDIRHTSYEKMQAAVKAAVEK